MRQVQRGISALFLVIAVLTIAVTLTAGYFTFYLDLKKTKQADSINSFEDCAKLYPIMESYPEQCNTPDGKHFVQQLREEEKQKLVPPSASALPVTVSSKSADGWTIYRNSTLGLEIQYPSTAYITKDQGSEVTIEIEYRPKGENRDLPIKISNNHTVNTKEINCVRSADPFVPGVTDVYLSKTCPLNIKEIEIGGKKAVTFSAETDQYIQVDNPLIEIKADSGVLSLRSEIYQKMLESIKFLK